MFRLVSFSKFCFVAITLVAAADCHAQFLHFGRAPSTRCLPGGFEYSAFDQSTPATAVSFSGTLVGTENTGASQTTVNRSIRRPDGTTTTVSRTRPTSGLRVKSFPLRVRTLTNDHCQLRNVAVALSSNGTWSIDFLAEQNPNLLPADQRPRFLVHQQNQFHVRVRPLLGENLVTVDALDNVAVPSVACLHVRPFWMKRVSQKQMRSQGHSEDVRRNFDRIGHVAVDLVYR